MKICNVLATSFFSTFTPWDTRFFVQVTQSCISEPQRPYTIAPPGQHGNQTTHLPFLVAITILSALFADLGDAFGCMMHHGLEHVSI